MKYPIAATVTLIASSHAAASVIPADPTLFLRTNTVGNNATEFVQYSTLADLAAGTASGLANINFNDHQVNDIFWDGTRFHRTYQNNGKVKIYSWDSLEDYGDNSKVTISNLSNTWSANDDFWSDQSGNYYRTSTSNSASSGVTKYSSFANLLSNTGGTFTSFTTNFGLGDRFWAYGSKFYKTTVGSNGVSTIKVYGSLEALGANNAESTFSTSIAYSTSDAFVFIPAPGAVALLGMSGLAGQRRRR